MKDGDDSPTPVASARSSSSSSSSSSSLTKISSSRSSSSTSLKGEKAGYRSLQRSLLRDSPLIDAADTIQPRSNKKLFTGWEPVRDVLVTRDDSLLNPTPNFKRGTSWKKGEKEKGEKGGDGSEGSSGSESERTPSSLTPPPPPFDKDAGETTAVERVEKKAEGGKKGGTKRPASSRLSQPPPSSLPHPPHAQSPSLPSSSSFPPSSHSSSSSSSSTSSYSSPYASPQTPFSPYAPSFAYVEGGKSAEDTRKDFLPKLDPKHIPLLVSKKDRQARVVQISSKASFPFDQPVTKLQMQKILDTTPTTIPSHQPPTPTSSRQPVMYKPLGIPKSGSFEPPLLSPTTTKPPIYYKHESTAKTPTNFDPQSPAKLQTHKLDKSGPYDPPGPFIPITKLQTLKQSTEDSSDPLTSSNARLQMYYPRSERMYSSPRPTLSASRKSPVL